MDGKFISVENEGKKLKTTNYWQSEHAEKGYFYLSVNVGCVRLLCPSSNVFHIPDIRTGKVVIISNGTWVEKGKEGVGLLFEDYSENSFALHM